MMVAMLHCNGQLRTDRDGDTEKRCQNLLYSRRLLMMMKVLQGSVATHLRLGGIFNDQFLI